MNVRLPDGTVINNVPDGISKADLVAKLKSNGYDTSGLEAAQSPKQIPQTEEPGTVSQVLKGAAVGAADIGNNLINAATFVPRTIERVASNITGETPLNDFNTQRQESLQGYIRDNGQSGAFTAGRLGSNIAGTLGAGPALGKTLLMLAKTPRAAALANSIMSSGTTGTLGNRIAGGAAAGAGGAAMVDPDSATTGAALGAAIPVAGAAARYAGGGVADFVGGVGTHTGGESVRQAAQAGLEGGQRAQSFTQNMRGNVPIENVLDDAKANLQTMRAAKSAEYRSGMVDISKDKTQLGFEGIEKSIEDGFFKTLYKGQVKDEKAAQAVQEIAEEVNAWRNLDPAEYHTPEGIDALKQRIGGIMESIPFEQKTARLVVSDIYRSIKNEISKQAPTYDKVMKNYSMASDQIIEAERALSLGNRASADTAIRKLQSLTRNNVATNYGNRLQAAQALEQQGGRQIMPALAGQALNSVTPRGLGGAVASMTGVGGLATMNPLAIPALAAQSPRLVGEIALKTGQAARQARKAVPAAGAISAYLYPND
jgi:hypothetical protein